MAMSHVYIKREATFRQMFGILTERMFPSASFEQTADQNAAVRAGGEQKQALEEGDRQIPTICSFHD